jgi:hypothetical protein
MNNESAKDGAIMTHVMLFFFLMVIIFVNIPFFTLDCRSLLASDKQRECRQTTINRRKKEKKQDGFLFVLPFFLHANVCQIY